MNSVHSCLSSCFILFLYIQQIKIENITNIKEAGDRYEIFQFMKLLIFEKIKKQCFGTNKLGKNLYWPKANL